jgi:hypothetical protein
MLFYGLFNLSTATVIFFGLALYQIFTINFEMGLSYLSNFLNSQISFFQLIRKLTLMVKSMMSVYLDHF